jgi:hypothetical protein
MPTNSALPSISSYTPHFDSNYGAHTLRIDLGPLTVWFSFKTPVAFRAPGTPTIVRQNDWGATTGKHLKFINGETSKTDTIQVAGEQFEELWAKHVELHELLDR